MAGHLKIPLSIFNSQQLLILAKILLILPIGLWGSEAIAQSKKETAANPASDSEIFLYRGLGASYVCNALTAKVEFPKAVGIAAATYTQLLRSRHGGKVASAGNKELTNEQLFNGSEFQIVTGAVQFCPKLVPEDIKKKIKEANKKLIEEERKNK